MALVGQLTWFTVSQVTTIQVENGFHVSAGVNDRRLTVEYTPDNTADTTCI